MVPLRNTDGLPQLNHLDGGCGKFAPSATARSRPYLGYLRGRGSPNGRDHWRQPMPAANKANMIMYLTFHVEESYVLLLG
eukprot:3442862-Amphidinium_carterae.1